MFYSYSVLSLQTIHEQKRWLQSAFGLRCVIEHNWIYGLNSSESSCDPSVFVQCLDMYVLLLCFLPKYLEFFCLSKDVHHNGRNGSRKVIKQLISPNDDFSMLLHYL